VARQRYLARAPITEALLSFGVPAGEPLPRENEDALVAALKDSFYLKGSITQGTFEFTVADEPTASAKSAAKHVGVRLHSHDEKYVLQATHSGMTLSRLEPYEDWERLKAMAHDLWGNYVDAFRPTEITQVAVRYINTIRIPVVPPTRLETVFERPPQEPAGMSDVLTAFLSRVVIQDEPAQATVVVTIASQPKVDDVAPVVIDIEALRRGNFRVSAPDVWEYIESLRILKNKAFFGSLMEEEVAKYE
jgi:uncharacterized protein (TIGR04255 family)